MQLIDLLNGLRRAPWLSAGRPILLDAGFSIHRGYDNTVENAMREQPDAARDLRLRTSLIEHLVAGEKLIRIAKLQPGERRSLETWVAGKRRTSNALTNAFPGVATTADLVSNKNLGLSSVGSVSLHNGSAALFTGARWYLSRVEVPTSRLKAGAADGFEKLIGIQRVFIQSYDAIWIPDSGDYACIATDFPVGVPKQFADASQEALQIVLRQVLGRRIAYFNFWPAVEGLYEAPDGSLVDYGFTVAGNQVNHHKSRRKGACLRKTIYDSAGAQAVGNDLQLFKVAMRWKVAQNPDLTSEPEILLPGTAADLNKANAVVDHAVLRDSLNSRDLNFVVSKLAPHMI